MQADANAGAMVANQGQVVEAGRGLAWWSEAWALFMRFPLLWILMALAMFVLLAVLSVVPVLGSLAAALLGPVFVGGWMLAASKVQEGGALEFGDLFSGFKDHIKPLMVLGALFMAASLVITVLAVLVGMGTAMGLGVGLPTRGHGGAGAGVLAMISGSLVFILLILLLSLPVGMAMWFSPGRVALHGVAPWPAVQQSFWACLRNWLPSLVCSLLGLVAAVAASIPFGLGWLVLMPLVFLVAYRSYRDVFGDVAAPASVSTVDVLL